MADRTHAVDWSGLGDDDDDDEFFESSDRTSSVVPLNLASSDDDEFSDSRMSFASARPSVSLGFPPPGAAASAASSTIDYGMWTEEPGSIQERRKRLLQGMGLNSGKNFIRLASVGLRAPSRKIGNCEVTPIAVETRSTNIEEGEAKPPLVPLLPFVPVVHERSHSEGDQDALSSDAKQRQKDLLGDNSKESLTRTSSLSNSSPRLGNYASESEGEGGRSVHARCPLSSTESDFGAVFFIKNLDTGKEFIVSEIDSDGMWNRLSDIQTGKQLTMEEFEKSVGYSPVVKELMRRQNVGADGIGGSERKPGMNSYISKSFRFSKRRGVALLKNIKGVANSFISEKDRENPPLQESKPTKNSSSEWIKARQHGKSHRELTALHLCQEFQAHEGSIWTIRFSSDGRYLASAGEDKVIHVWEAQECAATSAIKPPDEFSSFNPSSDKPPLPETPKTTEKKKKGKTSPRGSRKGNQIPDYIHMPETVFTLVETPVCSFKGHLDDVLDLSWSGSQVSFSPIFVTASRYRRRTVGCLWETDKDKLLLTNFLKQNKHLF